MNNAAPTTCQFSKLPNTIKTFKSGRAAKMAVTKADKAYDCAVTNRCTDEAHNTGGLTGPGADLHSRIDAYILRAWQNLEATVKTARQQGFSVHSSWYSRSNNTDILID